MSRDIKGARVDRASRLSRLLDAGRRDADDDDYAIVSRAVLKDESGHGREITRRCGEKMSRLLRRARAPQPFLTSYPIPPSPRSSAAAVSDGFHSTRRLREVYA